MNRSVAILPCTRGAVRIHAGLQRALAAVPSAVFSSNLPGKPKYSLPARVSCLGVKFLEYSLAGMVCGFVGQGMANGMMRVKCVPSPAS